MNRVRLSWFGVLLLALSCAQRTPSTSARLAGANHLVLVDELPSDGLLADAVADQPPVGVPHRYLFVTSTDSNELRVLRLWTEKLDYRQFVEAPNALETLSIPVIDRPMMLAVDEGVSVRGRLSTGSYVYAGRAGGLEIAVVGTAPSEMRQVLSQPLALPMPMTAMTAWMGSALTRLPDQTTLFVAGFDGLRGGIFRFTLATNAAQLRQASLPVADRLMDVGSETVVALHVLPPLAGRSVNGHPFCVGRSGCLAVATRKASGTTGRTFLIDLETSERVDLAFPWPVRQFASGGAGSRLFAILDEESCGDSSCRGTIGVDVESTSGTAFGVMRNALGEPMRVIGTDGALPMALRIVAGGTIRTTSEQYDGGASSLVVGQSSYDLLGVMTSSEGLMTFFDAARGTVIDYDIRRALVGSALLRTPGVFEDGGTALFDADGGVFGSSEAGAVTTNYEVSSDGLTRLPYSTNSIRRETTSENAPSLEVELGDGYMVSQQVVVVYQGTIPGLVDLATSAADGTTLKFPASHQSRIRAGDDVVFDRDGVVCGEAQVAAIADGSLDVNAIPTECGDRNHFSVRAAAVDPFVIVAESDGYLGRVREDETFTYIKDPLLLTAGTSTRRSALTLKVTPAPQVRGQYWSFQLQANLTPQRVSFNLDDIDCATRLPGHFVMAQMPRQVNNTLVFPWTIMASFPSAQGIVEFDPQQAIPAQLTRLQGLLCYR